MKKLKQNEIKYESIIADLQQKLKGRNLIKSDVFEFFKLFEKDELLSTISTTDWWCGAINTLKSEELLNEFFIPFMEYILITDQNLKDIFIGECARRVTEDISFAEAKILEIFLCEISLEKARKVFENTEQQFFSIFYQLFKKLAEYKWKKSSYSTDFWPYGFVEHVGKIFSHVVKYKVVELINNDNLDELLFLSYERFIQSLTLIDFIHLILDPEVDLINFIITKNMEKDDKHGLFEDGFDLPDDSWRISQFISKKLMDVLKELNKEKIDALMGLYLHLHIHFRDFVRLPFEAKKLFFVVAHEHDQKYHEGERQNLDWQLGQLKYLESGYILQYIIEIIQKGDIKEIRDLFQKEYIALLNREDFTYLWEESDFNLLEIIVKINKDLDLSFYMSIYLYNKILKPLKGKIGEKLIRIIQKRDINEIKILFLIGVFDLLNQKEISFLLMDLSFIELLEKIRREEYKDTEVGKKINKFIKKNESEFNLRFK